MTKIAFHILRLMMRIGFDAKRLYNNFTGLGNYSRTLVKNLIKENQKDHQYLLFSPRAPLREDTAVFTEMRQCRTILPKIKAKGIWRSLLLPRILNDHAVDIYHGLSNEVPFNINQFKGKSVVTIHDLIFKRYPDTYKAIDRKIYDYKFKYSCHHADHIIAISESTKRDVMSYYGIPEDKISVVYQSCDPLYYHETGTGEASSLDDYNLPQDFLLYVGSIAERKNIISILKAYRQLSSSDRLPLVIVGQGKKYKATLMKYAITHGLAKEIIWIENLSDNKLLKTLYQRSTAFIYISLFEGFGLPVAEAALCGTPVITSNISSMPEAAGPDTLLVDPLDIEAISTAIKQVVSNQSLRDKMIKTNQVYAETNFNAARSSRALMDIYLNLLS